MQHLDDNLRVVYRGHLLSCRPRRQDDGSYHAQVAITCVDGPRTISQRFIDLEGCPSLDDAVSVAHAAGVAWVDSEWDR